MTSDPTRNLWDQQDGESNAAYARFLMYRNLGPSRSLRVAADISEPDETKRDRSLSQWKRDSTAYQWVERATAWDVAMLSSVGRDVVVNFVATLQAMSRKTLEALARDSVKPKDWQQVLNAISILGGFIPAETVEAVQSTAERGDIPAVGTATPHDS